MSHRYRFAIHVQCPQCGTNDVAQCSETADAVWDTPAFRVDRDPERITSTHPANNMNEQRWRCDQCGVLFR